MAKIKRVEYYVLDRRLADYEFDFIPQQRVEKEKHFENVCVRFDNNGSNLIVHNRLYATASNGKATVNANAPVNTATGRRYLEAFFNAEKVDEHIEVAMPSFTGSDEPPIALDYFRCTGMGKEARQARKNSSDKLARQCIAEASAVAAGSGAFTVEYLNRVWAYLYGLYVEANNSLVRSVFTHITDFIKQNSLFLDLRQFYLSSTSVYNGQPVEQRIPKQRIYDMYALDEKLKEDLSSVLTHCQFMMADKQKAVEWFNGWVFVNGMKFVRLSGDAEKVNVVISAMEQVYGDLM